jgi:hypothetical protein
VTACCGWLRVGLCLTDQGTHGRKETERDWDTFDAYHDQSDVVVYWPDRECTPTRGGPDHRAESERFCAAFPDNKVKHPYDILFGDGELTAFVGPFTGMFTGPVELRRHRL